MPSARDPGVSALPCSRRRLIAPVRLGRINFSSRPFYEGGHKECVHSDRTLVTVPRWRPLCHRSLFMFNRRVLLSAFLATGLVAGGVAVAKTHHHHDAHALLGAKLHQNGKHEVGKIGNNTVTAEVSNNKHASMSSGNLPVLK